MAHPDYTLAMYIHVNKSMNKIHFLTFETPSVTDGYQEACQDVAGNDGSVSCSAYCAGISGGPWNGELPKSWNGSTCAYTYYSDAQKGTWMVT